jgi:5-methylcytosine-specific restriction endonuclease McrA
MQSSLEIRYFSSHPISMNGDRPSTRSLLLNSSFEPMKILNWQKALVLLFQGKVEVIEFHDLFVKSVYESFQLPAVLRLKKYVRPRSYGTVRFCRENIYIRDNFTCQYCGDKFPYKLLTLDHVVPASHLGPKTWTNVVTACRNCNQRKANRTPHVANMPLLTEPKKPQWLPTSDIDINSSHVPSVWLQYLEYKAG